MATRARLALPATALLLLLVGGIWGAGAVETIHRYEHISYERAVYILDTTRGDAPEAALAQQRLKALVSVALATLARQAASGGELGYDASRFLEAVRHELGGR